MEVLWAPWRYRYVESATASTERSCIFCEAVRDADDEKHLVVYRSRHSIAMLNLYPYNTAHTMVAPRRHVPSIELLTDEELLDLFKLVSVVMKALRMEYKPQGFNVGVNVGRVAGAGIESHVHVHVVPRWSGDTNFMPVIAGTKVIPEDLRTTWRRVKKAISLVLSGEGRLVDDEGARFERSTR